MKRVLICTDETLQAALAQQLSHKKWKLRFCNFYQIDTVCEEFLPDFLLIELPFPACSLRMPLLRLYKKDLHPYIILFDIGICFRYATSYIFEKEATDRQRDASQLLDILFASLSSCNLLQGEIIEYTNERRIHYMKEKIARAEFLRDSIGGISDSAFRQNIKTFRLNLNPKGHYLLVLKGMAPDFYEDYRNNRSVYYLLEEQQRQQVYDVLNKYSGGEIVYTASKHTECLLFNDFPQKSLMKKKKEMDLFLEELYTVTNDGQTAHFLSGFIPAPSQINAAYSDCYLLRQYHLFFSDCKYLRADDFKQHFLGKQASPSVLSSALKQIQGFDVSSDKEVLRESLEKIFGEIKKSIDLNAFRYCCGALDLYYENFCRRYGLHYNALYSSLTANWAVSIDDISHFYLERYQSAFTEAAHQNKYGDSSIAHIISYVKTHYNKALTLDDISACVHMNPSYVSRKFKQCTGVSLGHYIKQIRMENAKELLHSGNLRVKEVSAAVGYTDSRLFSKTFREYTGTLPSDYARTL